MNVVESDNITSTVSYLRKNVYSSPDFKSSFIENVSNELNVVKADFFPEQYGGWSISITTGENDSKSNTSEFYLNKIMNPLKDTIKQYAKYIDSDSINSGILNVITTGSDTFTVKI